MLYVIKGEKSFFNHKTMKKLFLDWIRNEISFIYRIVIKSLETVYQIKRTLKQQKLMPTIGFWWKIIESMMRMFHMFSSTPFLLRCLHQKEVKKAIYWSKDFSFYWFKRNSHDYVLAASNSHFSFVIISSCKEIYLHFLIICLLSPASTIRR